ncbi:hypothetical protein SAMN04487911_1605 [Arenibacter nanhaiticus]|uniref:Uncharacterized protein n=1 Tax=Arenibacter nanhaiticus TaxID=558155 RepID=A0A1M6NAP6_9FLAO|nr:hypothetical protein [Arenibacter nanhaiticus]SHJ92744.1 hypothetical protein SAMN04487911_1605 [Arenibacter nanhaiticus]
MKRVLAILSVMLFVFCGNINELPIVQETKIRVINRTNNNFSNVVLFSMEFSDLKPKDTSEYKILNYDPLRDDPLIYCSMGEINYARYLEIPKEGVLNFTYAIDSIQEGIIYVSSVVEN